VVPDWATSEAKSVEAKNLDADATLTQIRRDVEARFGDQKPAAGAVDAMTLLVLTDVATSGQSSLRASKAKLDALGSMSEAESLQMQMAMDRLSKMISTLTNLEKKISTTSAGITQNLK
jgi:hypothetical protein